MPSKINIIQIPVIAPNKQLSVDRLYASRKETIRELKEKLFRILGTRIDSAFRDVKNCKLWKLDDRYTIPLLQELAEKNSKVQLVNCKRLEDKSSLEDCELSETDTVLVEYKLNGDWVFTSEREIKQNEAVQCAACHSFKKNLQFCVCMQVLPLT